MNNLTEFLTVMAGISAAAQILTEHVIKKRLVAQLDMQRADPVEEARRQSLIHLISGLFGGLLAWSIDVHPVRTYLAPGHGLDPFWEYLIVGLMVSYGGSFFNEALGLIRQFKLVQEEVRKATVPPLPPEVPILEVPPPSGGPEELEVRVIGTEGYDSRYTEEA